MIGGDEKEKDGEFYDERNDVDQPITSNNEKEEEEKES